MALRRLLVTLLLLLAVRLHVYSQSYSITEEEMTILEQTLRGQETDLMRALEIQKTLLTETERLKTYCDKLETEARTYKALAIGGVSIGVAGLVTGIILCLTR